MQRRSTSVAAIAVAWVVAAQLASTGSVEAQLFDRALVIRNARIVTMAGPVIERGSILIKGGRIAAIGPEVDAPFFSRTIDVDGKTVTPGLIDAWSSLGRLNGSRGSADPTASAWDAFDRFDRDSFRQALRNGVTTIYVGPTGGPGIAGTGVVVRLAPEPGGKAGKLIEEHAALAVNFGSSQNAIARAKTYLAIRKQFRTALDYRQALEDYEEDLKEYIEKLEERREEKEKEEAKEKKEGDEDGEKEEDTPPEDSPKPEPKPTPKP
ncbi:MAG: hypothetical protein IID43_06900, partial [Planctomycetes bacterium]|nr:hypothetical protein [Planctomycetota bacterium]